MNILGISGGSKNGTNDAMCKEALMGAKEIGAEVEFIRLLDLNLKPCTGCVSCVIGPNGAMNGGSGRCVIKDDFPWLDDKYLDADGVIFVMPIFEKGVPGIFKLIQDRLAGPSHDTGIMMIAKKISEQKDTQGPDPRHFKRKFVSYIGIGGSDWDTRMEADFRLFGMSAMLECIDNLIFNWSKSMLAEDNKVARVREAGRSIARAVKNPDTARYLGNPGICQHCNSNLMRLNEDAKKVECSVCSIVGELKIMDGKIKFEFAPEQLEHAHDTIAGKFKHMDDIAKIETEFAALTKTEEFKKRQEAYKTFIQLSMPN